MMEKQMHKTFVYYPLTSPHTHTHTHTYIYIIKV